MRLVILDTETTGLEASQGHRIIEIGCVEMQNRRVSERRFHQYLNPEREIDAGAMEVHGITNEQLTDKPRFAEVARDFLDFVEGAELVIHNAPFDVGFINSELKLLGPEWGQLTDYCTILDTLVMARKLHPGQKNNLDALCKRYEIDNSRRELHGALLDAEILADVYLAMTGGQTSLTLGSEGEGGTQAMGESEVIRPVEKTRPPLRVIAASASELAAHEARLDAIEGVAGAPSVWRRSE